MNTSLDSIPYRIVPDPPEFVFSFNVEMEQTRPLNPREFWNGEWSSLAIFYGYYNFSDAKKVERIVKAWGLRYIIAWYNFEKEEHIKIPTVYHNKYLKP